MRKCILIIIIICTACTNNPETYLQRINGYWEIQEVTMADGTKRQYSINETIDYIEINDSLVGFRKKLKPGINDTYYTSDDAEAITAKVEGDDLILHYATPYSTWKETVLEASKENLKVVNENNVVYLYKRYNPINLNIED